MGFLCVLFNLTELLINLVLFASILVTVHREILAQHALFQSTAEALYFVTVPLLAFFILIKNFIANQNMTIFLLLLLFCFFMNMALVYIVFLCSELFIAQTVFLLFTGQKFLKVLNLFFILD